MPNQININDVAGDLGKLNSQLKITADYLAKLTADAEKLNAALVNSKGIKEFNDNLAKSQKLQTETQNAQNKALLDNEKILQAKIKTQKMATDAMKKEESAWDSLNKAHKAALKDARDMGVLYGKNSKQFKDAADKANKYAKEMKGLNAELGGVNPNGVGKYFQAIMKGAGALGLVVGGVELAKKAFEGLKNGSQTFGDAFAREMGALNGATSTFFSMIGTGNMDNFVQRLKDGAKAGRELADAMDDMMEFGLSIEILEANVNKEIAAQEVLRNNVNLTTEERIDAAQKINEEEEKLAKAKEDEAKRIFNAYAKNVEDGKKVDRDKLIAFITNYREEEKLREKVIAKTKELNSLEKARTQILQSGGDTKNIDRQIAAFEKTYTEQELIYSQFLKRYGELTDDEINNTIKAYSKITEVETESRDRKLRNETKLNKFIKELSDEELKELELKNKNIEAKNKEAWEAEKKMLEAKAKMQNEDNKLRDEQDKIEIDRQVKAREERRTLDQEYADAEREILEQEKEFFAKREEEKTAKAKEEQQKRIQLAQEYLSAAGNFGNILFELGNAQRDAELENIESSYDKRIEAAEGNAELQKSLGLELERERKRIAREEAVANRNQALFNIAISTAEAVAKVWAQTGVLGVAAQLLPISMGILQAAVVLSRPLPGYFKGTENAPAGWAWLAEQGRELVSMPDGSSFIQDKPTLYNFKGGEKVKTHEATERLINNEANGVGQKRESKVINNLSVNIDKQGLVVIADDRNNYTKYINEKVRH